MDDRVHDEYIDNELSPVEDAALTKSLPTTKRRIVVERKDMSAVVAECIGCFLFIFIGAGSILANTWTQGVVGLVGIAAAHGLALGILITIFGVTSGGHFNPAVTIAFLIARRIKPVLALCYIAAQLAGAILGAFLLRIVFPTNVWKSSLLGTPGLSTGISVGAGISVEALLTFFLMLTIYGTAVDIRVPKIGGMAIGLTVMVNILGGGVLTGGAMNPARAFGPALASGIWANQFVYWIGPIVGAVLAACFYEYLILPRSEEEADFLEPQDGYEESVVPQQVKERNFIANHPSKL
ncbi:hypothetical protein KDA_63180 [Dictyobacter alpinus]|uniref:Aquaporin n=1 Tax=Dictyobacter alpinus TaxID=2014873 RepID=A0A402BHE2_9CHLR|nr:MIP/aquaporin family protein [Dictyobacter alpinus]GCE30834.1 hypothetical protein KDA_63180 [Dictyobacter alpinus]